MPQYTSLVGKKRQYHSDSQPQITLQQPQNRITLAPRGGTNTVNDIQDVQVLEEQQIKDAEEEILVTAEDISSVTGESD